LRIFLASVNRESAPYAVAPLGISYVAGAARAEGHEVELLDLCFSTDVEGDIDRAVRRFAPELIGISIRNVDNLTYPASVSYLADVRQAVVALRRASRAPTAAGGAGFSIFPGQLLALLDLDFGVIGEGEETFCLLARYLARGIEIPEIPNLIRRGEDPRAVSKRLASFVGSDVPARDLVDNARYLELGGMANLQTKRGCPFQCIYCTYHQINGPSLRLRSPSKVVDELAAMVTEAKLDEVFFVDDIFNWPHDHAMSICEEIVARRLQVRWTCFATPLGITLELARAMKRAGCRGVEFGTDTASPPMLRALGKPFVQEEIRVASGVCREAGLPDAHYLVFGGPGETAETMAETFAFFDDLKPHALLAFLGIRIYPRTLLHEAAISDGVIAEGDDLLLPRFYISPRIGADELKRAVGSHAEARPNWVVPGLGIRSDPALLAALRRSGRRGPLWDLLRSAP
jgi:radical SAM superfamily enzyme YgiQ (UPF0313 family)